MLFICKELVPVTLG